ncbi:hypothetical protein D7Y04_40920 [Corallococcus sp. AB038B]|nr:hypothetical protein D7Y04_40920 [Corallococcus sp. AB038B]
MSMKRILSLMIATLALACSGPDMHDAGEEGGESLATQENAASYYVCGAPVFNCPSGYTILNQFCSAHCTTLGYSCATWGYNETLCYKPDPITGTISATPTNVRINLDVTQTGTTNVCFDVSGISEGEVWLSVNNQSEVLFARGDNFCQAAPWITAGNTFAFKLYSGRAHTTLLATATVTGEGYRGGTNPPPQCGPCQSGYSCFCGDRVCRREGTMCP